MTGLMEPHTDRVNGATAAVFLLDFSTTGIPSDFFSEDIPWPIGGSRWISIVKSWPGCGQGIPTVILPVPVS